MADAPPLRRGRAASSTNRNPFELFAELCAHFNFGKPIFKLIKSHNNNPPKTIQMGLTVIKLGISGNTKFLPCHYDKILILFFFFFFFVIPPHPLKKTHLKIRVRNITSIGTKMIWMLMMKEMKVN
jgi:hypothetical protein